MRSLAVAATGAIAVFGSVAITGAQHNLQNGLDRTAYEWNHVSDLWVSPVGSREHAGDDRRSRRRSPRGSHGCRIVRERKHLPGQLPGLRRSPRVGDRSPAQLLAADPVRSAQRRQRQRGQRAPARSRLGGPLRSDRPRTAPSHRRVVHAALTPAHHVPSRGHEPRTAAGRRARSSSTPKTTPRLGLERGERAQRRPRARRLACASAAHRSDPRARAGLGPGGAERRRTRRASGRRSAARAWRG